MKTYVYKMTNFRLSGTELLAEASAEELRVLAVLSESGGRITLDALAQGASVRQARAAAALTLWSAAGVITLTQTDADGEKNDEVVDEFSYRLQADVIDEESSVDVAAAIRDRQLQAMLTECAALLGRPTLNDREIHLLTSLCSQYALAEDFIITLLSDMCTRSRATVRTLVNRAIKLSEDGVDTVEKLNAYIEQRNSVGEWERRARSVLGIYSRALTAEEKTLFRKWVELFGFGEDILSLAYDKTVHNTSQYSAPYMDKILTDWHAHNCRTAADCEAHYAAARPALSSSVSKGKAKAPKERYGAFDPDEAFRRALERSYSTPTDETAAKS